jgi:hypothetical protein
MHNISFSGALLDPAQGSGREVHSLACIACLDRHHACARNGRGFRELACGHAFKTGWKSFTPMNGRMGRGGH